MAVEVKNDTLTGGVKREAGVPKSLLVQNMRVIRPRVLICGAGMQTNESAMKGFREINPKVQLQLLPSDFSTAEAGQAGIDLVNRIRVLLSGQQ